LIGIIGSIGMGHRGSPQKNRSLLSSIVIGLISACTLYSIYLVLLLTLGKNYITFEQLNNTPHFLATASPFFYLIALLLTRCIMLAVAEITVLVCSACTELNYSTHIIKRLAFLVIGSGLVATCLISVLPPWSAGLLGCALGVIIVCVQYLAYSIDTRIMPIALINFYVIDYFFSLADINLKTISSLALVTVLNILLISKIEKVIIPKVYAKRNS